MCIRLYFYNLASQESVQIHLIAKNRPSSKD